MALFEGFTKGYSDWSNILDQAKMNKLKQEEQAMQNKYMPDYLQSRNDIGSNQAGLLGVDLQYAPEKARLANEMSGAKLKYQNIDNQFAPENFKSANEYKRAQAALATSQAKYAPLEMLMKAQQMMQTGSRFGGAYQMSRALQAMAPAARELWVSQNQEAYDQMLKELGNQQGNTSLITPEVLNKYLPEANIPAQQNNIAPPMAPQQNRFQASTPQQIQQTQLANQISANNSVVTPATRRQLEGAIQVENIVNDPGFQQRAVDASEYAGALGKGKAGIQALSQQNPKAYENYLTFKNVDMVLLQNRIKTLDQMGATDEQRKELNGLYDKAMNSLTSNPKQFRTQFDNLQKALMNVAQSVQKSATPLAPVNRLEGAKLIGKETAPKQDYSKMSDAQLRKLAGW